MQPEHYVTGPSRTFLRRMAKRGAGATGREISGPLRPVVIFWERLCADRRGNMAFMMMATLVGVALVAGGVIDYSSLVSQRMSVKEAASSAALAAASEMLLVGSTEAQALAVAEAIASQNLGADGVSVTLTVPEENQISVTVSAAPRTFFPGPVGLTASIISETSSAEVAGQGNVCVLSLEPNKPQGLAFSAGAKLAAGGCLIYVNSKNPNALSLAAKASVQADFVCVSGGVSGPEDVVSGRVLADCPPVEDPLAARPLPPEAGSACSNYGIGYGNGAFRMPSSQKVFCGDLFVGPGARLTIPPGIYVFRNSRMTIQGTLLGEGVGFIFTGNRAGFDFFQQSRISLSAPKTGNMAGLLTFQRDKANWGNRILSDKAERLVGTLYQPGAGLLVDSSTGQVAARSEYTVVVAESLFVGAGPDLVLNTDYGASDVPVPVGLGNNARNSVRLTK